MAMTDAQRLASLKYELETTRKLLDAAVAEVQSQKVWVDIAAPVMNWLAEDECYFDHHGYCQAHGPMEDGKCLVGVWREREER